MTRRKHCYMFNRLIISIKCILKVKVIVPSGVWLCDHVDYTVHEILQARILEQVASPFSRESFQPKNQTRVSHIAGRFFASWDSRKAWESWSGIKPGSPALQADSLSTELSGKPLVYIEFLQINKEISKNLFKRRQKIFLKFTEDKW